METEGGVCLFSLFFRSAAKEKGKVLNSVGTVGARGIPKSETEGRKNRRKQKSPKPLFSAVYPKMFLGSTSDRFTQVENDILSRVHICAFSSLFSFFRAGNASGVRYIRCNNCVSPKDPKPFFRPWLSWQRDKEVSCPLSSAAVRAEGGAHRRSKTDRKESAAENEAHSSSSSSSSFSSSSSSTNHHGGRKRNWAEVKRETFWVKSSPPLRPPSPKQYNHPSYCVLFLRGIQCRLDSFSKKILTIVKLANPAPALSPSHSATKSCFAWVGRRQQSKANYVGWRPFIPYGSGEWLERTAPCHGSNSLYDLACSLGAANWGKEPMRGKKRACQLADGESFVFGGTETRRLRSQAQADRSLESGHVWEERLD